MQKNNKINKYIKFLDELIVDEEIKEKIINKIKFYSNNGKLYIDNKNLVGKYENTSNLSRCSSVNEFLDIKYDNFTLFCNYYEEFNEKVVNIVQTPIKGGNVRINMKETYNNKTCNNHNDTGTKEIEKIYGYYKNLIHKSTFISNYKYDTFPELYNSINYSDIDFSNYNYIKKDWYIFNGSIIRYELSKKFIYGNCDLYEKYLLCPKRKDDQNIESNNFINLDKSLFQQFMTNQITIEELLSRNNGQKKLLKNK